MQRNATNNTKWMALLCMTLAPLSVKANSPFDSFYLGVGVGDSFTSGRLNSGTMVTQNGAGGGEFFSNFTNLRHFQHLKRDSWFGALYGGYGFSCDYMYLGGELSIKFSGHNTATTSHPVVASDMPVDTTAGAVTSGVDTIDDTTTLTFRKVEYTLDARPGVLLSPCTLFYGRIGVAFNRATLNSNINATINETFISGGGALLFGATNSFSIAQSASKKVGIRFGLGIEQSIKECISLRLDYVYTRYRKINLATNTSNTAPIAGTNGPGPAFGTFVDVRQVKPYNHSVMLGLTYYW